MRALLRRSAVCALSLLILIPCTSACTSAETGSAYEERCVSGGCSGELCLPKSSVAVEGISFCASRPEHACLKRFSRCGRYGTGNTCAWEQTAQVAACVFGIKVANEHLGICETFDSEGRCIDGDTE